jgi:hypothetical protein
MITEGKINLMATLWHIPCTDCCPNELLLSKLHWSGDHRAPNGRWHRSTRLPGVLTVIVFACLTVRERSRSSQPPQSSFDVNITEHIHPPVNGYGELAVRRTGAEDAGLILSIFCTFTRRTPSVFIQTGSLEMGWQRLADTVGYSAADNSIQWTIGATQGFSWKRRLLPSSIFYDAWIGLICLY